MKTIYEVIFEKGIEVKRYKIVILFIYMLSKMFKDINNMITSLLEIDRNSLLNHFEYVN